MTPRDLDRIEARLEELEHGQEDHHARIAAMEAKPSTTGPPINEAGITATFAAIFARLDALEADARAVGACLSAQVCMNSNTQDALERLESARIAAPTAPESAETGPGVPMEPGNATEAQGHEVWCNSRWPHPPQLACNCNASAEVAAALRMYRKVQACTVDADHHFVYCGDGATWKLAENLLAWLKEGEA